MKRHYKEITSEKSLEQLTLIPFFDETKMTAEYFYIRQAAVINSFISKNPVDPNIFNEAHYFFPYKYETLNIKLLSNILRQKHFNIKGSLAFNNSIGYLVFTITLN